MPRDPMKVAVLAFDGLCTFEFGIVIELFGLPRPEFETWYDLRVARAEDGPLRAIGGLRFEAPYTLKVLDSAGTIIVPGWRGIDEPVPDKLARKLRRAFADGARIVSICSGAFVLAAAGLLNGRRATTHWRYADSLASRYPQIEVDPDVLFVDEGNIITSAGSAAGIDMGLHLIRRDLGASVASQVAKRLVVPPQRDGGQKQFIEAPIASDPDEHAIAGLIDALRHELPEKHSIETMSRRIAMSRRTFLRRFKAATGTTPHRWLQNERVRLAQSLLETTGLPLDDIATRSGFADAQLLRMHFKRVVGTSPNGYRRSFATR